MGRLREQVVEASAVLLRHIQDQFFASFWDVGQFLDVWRAQVLEYHFELCSTVGAREEGFPL